MNSPVRFIDPSGHFTEEAIWNHIYNDLCNGSSACASDMMSKWRNNVEWWDMLIAAQAGDVIFGAFFDDFGNPLFNDSFRFSGDGTTRLSGIMGTLDMGLHNLFVGEHYRDSGFTYVWGGWYSMNSDNLIIGIHHRRSVTTVHGEFVDDVLWESINYGLGAGFVGAVTCLPAAPPVGSLACGTIASGITSAGSSFIPEHYDLQNGESLVVSAGEVFVYSRLTEFRGDSFTYTLQGHQIRIYGSKFYTPRQILRVIYTGN